MASHTYTVQDLEEGRAVPGTLSLTPGDPGQGDAPLPGGEPVENDDGSVTFPELEDISPKPGAEFLENLAEVLPSGTLSGLARSFLDKIELDREARKQRDKQYEEGLKRTGLSGEAPGGADFDGASRVAHPLLAEACIDYAAAAIKELFPPSGPVRTQLRGHVTPQKKELGRRKAEYLNWQLTTEIEEYRDTLEQVLSQVPMGGSQLMKFRHDDRLGRAAVDFAPIDEVFIPYHATSFYTASRITHLVRVTRQEFEERIESGLYRDLGLITDPTDLNLSGAAQVSDKIEGKEDSLAYDEDGLRTLYEVYAWTELEEDPLAESRWTPYIITIDEYSQQVLSIYRNWDPQDKRQRKLDWWVEWGFVPWRGAMKLGLPHLIGGLSAAATGALRALLDSAHLNNTAAAVKLKGGRQSGANTQINVTQVQEIEAPANVDDIRKLIMPMPFNPPSPVLFQLLGWLTDAGKGVVTTSEEKIADASNSMPVGTTLALIEQGAKVYSSIHARNHASQARALKIICRLNAGYLDEQRVVETFGEQLVSRADFAKNDDVQPVSDPNIFSETQRLARQQAVLQMAQDQSVNWNKTDIYRDMLLQMKVDDVDRYLPPTPMPVTADPVSENVAAVLQGAPLQATPEQDHLSHLHEHLRFVTDPLGGGNPLTPGPALQGIMAHCTQHMMLLYQTLAGSAAQVIAMQNQANGHPLSPDLLASAAAEASSKMLQQQLQPMLQLLQQAAQAVQQKQPPQPMDPTQATYQAAMAETQRRAQRDQEDVKLAQQKQQAELEQAAQQRQADQAAIVEELRQAAAQQKQDFLLALAEQRQAFHVELTKLAQGQQQLQLEAEKLSGVMTQDFHDRLMRVAEFSLQQSQAATAQQPGGSDATNQE